MSLHRQLRLTGTGLLARLRGAVLFLPLLAVPGHAQTVTMTVNATQSVQPISRYIYGVNTPLDPATNLTFLRMGGNRWTAYNWENNASNAGSDYHFQNDDYLGGGNTPGGALIDAINNAKANSAGLLLTVPINGYVAADKSPGGDVRNSGANYLQTRFRQDVSVKGAPFTLTPDTSDPYVYQDEFVNWVKTLYPYSQQAGTATPIWFGLDNEPDLWSETHAEVHPNPVTYAEMVSKTTSYATGIKAVAPNALVFGLVSYGWAGYVRLQDAPDANNRDFLDFFLDSMNSASNLAGKRLLDVLDLHWYPEAQSSDGIRIDGPETTPTVVAARLQAPRSLWDSTYIEKSWITSDWFNPPESINLLPRLAGKITAHYPGTKLAFTEYNYGAGQHISGGIAQADVLGIFGRYGVFAATQFPLLENPDGSLNEAFVYGALRMYRNFDGHNGSFGDTSVSAVTSNNANTSVYASLDSTNAKRMVLVVINKTASPITATINLSNTPVFKLAAIYQLTGASALPVAAGTMSLSNPAQVSYSMPPYSVSTLELTAGSPHDFDGSGRSDIAWRDSSGNTAIWLMNGGQVASSSTLGVVPAVWSIVGQRDLNGDGKHDLLWRDTSGNTAIWFMNGLQVSSSVNIGNVSTSWSVVGIDDFNGDGKADILWRDSGGNTAIWFMNGGQISSTAGLGVVPTIWSVVGTGDFNGDGKADLLWRDSGGNTAIWLMNGGQVSSTAGLGVVPPSWAVRGTGDFNGDGKSDILWRDNSGNTAIWFLNGGLVSSTAGLGAITTSWTIAETGDFNGDGKGDILWRDTGGNTAIWFMNGASITSTASLGAVLVAWTIQGTNVD